MVRPLAKGSIFFLDCHTPSAKDKECCSDDNKCQVGEGDCDSSSECEGDLVCGRNNCKDFSHHWPSDYDCCQSKCLLLAVFSACGGISTGKKMPAYSSMDFSWHHN